MIILNWCIVFTKLVFFYKLYAVYTLLGMTVLLCDHEISIYQAVSSE